MSKTMKMKRCGTCGSFGHPTREHADRIASEKLCLICYGMPHVREDGKKCKCGGLFAKEPEFRAEPDQRSHAGMVADLGDQCSQRAGASS